MSEKFGWWKYLLGVLVVGVAAGMVWFAISPRTIGRAAAAGTVAYPVPDDPTALVVACYLVVTAAAGLVCGLPAVALLDRFAVHRTVVLVAAGLPAALIAAVVGGLLGPDPLAVQIAAHPDAVQVPLALPTLLVALTWPAATAALAAVGQMLSILVLPGATERRH